MLYLSKACEGLFPFLWARNITYTNTNVPTVSSYKFDLFLFNTWTKRKNFSWSDIGRVHQHDVIKGALEAKREIQKSNPNVHLKNDPTQGLDLQNPPTLPKVSFQRLLNYSD